MSRDAVHSVVAVASLSLLGAGLGWWVHPGAGCVVIGAVLLAGIVYARTSGQ